MLIFNGNESSRDRSLPTPVQENRSNCGLLECLLLSKVHHFFRILEECLLIKLLLFILGFSFIFAKGRIFVGDYFYFEHTDEIHEEVSHRSQILATCMTEDQNGHIRRRAFLLDVQNIYFLATAALLENVLLEVNLEAVYFCPLVHISQSFELTTLCFNLEFSMHSEILYFVRSSTELADIARHK